MGLKGENLCDGFFYLYVSVYILIQVKFVFREKIFDLCRKVHVSSSPHLFNALPIKYFDYFLIPHLLIN